MARQMGAKAACEETKIVEEERTDRGTEIGRRNESGDERRKLGREKE